MTNGIKHAVILSGGGAYGAFEVGVLKSIVTNQIGGGLMYAAGEELATEWFAQILFGRGAVLGHSAGMLVAKAEQGEPLRFSVHWLS